jgi:hypothetical protein
MAGDAPVQSVQCFGKKKTGMRYHHPGYYETEARMSGNAKDTEIVELQIT